MNCEEFEKYIFDYLTDQNFDLKLREEMEKHYFECDKCFNNLELMSATIGVIQTEGVDKLLQYSEEKMPISLKERLNSLLSSLKRLATDRSFPLIIYSLDTVRGEGEKALACKIGETVIIQIELPRDWNDGYLTVLHYDEEDNLKIIFPHKRSDNTFVRSGKKKRIPLEVTVPKGKHFLKAIVTFRQLIKPNEIEFTNTLQIASVVEEYLDSIAKLDKYSWIETYMEFEVI